MKIFIDTIGNLGNIFLCIKYGIYLCEKYNLNVNESLYVVYPYGGSKLKSFELNNAKSTSTALQKFNTVDRHDVIRNLDTSCNSLAINGKYGRFTTYPFVHMINDSNKCSDENIHIEVEKTIDSNDIETIYVSSILKFDYTIPDKYKFLFRDEKLNLELLNQYKFITDPNLYVMLVRHLEVFACTIDEIQYLMTQVLNKNPLAKFYIAADDIDWCKKNISNDEHIFGFHYNINAYYDALLFSNARHIVPTHGTFRFAIQILTPLNYQTIEYFPNFKYK